MEIIVRKAKLDDTKGIVEVYCSSINKWVKRVDGREVEVRYEDLSLVERWSYGGPWMSIETCAVHLNYLLTWGQHPLVALINGRVVGELELYIGYEKGLLGKHGFIDVLEVYASFRRRGIGRRLVEKAAEIALEQNCNVLAVWPNPEATGFYRKCGFNEIAFKVKDVELVVPRTKGTGMDKYTFKEFPENYDTLGNWFFVTPRIESSFVAWVKSRWDYAVEEGVVKYFDALIPELNVAVIIESIWMNQSRASLYLWVKDLEVLDQALEVSLSIASMQGYNSLRVLLSNDVYEKHVDGKYKHRVLGEHIVLAKRL